MKRIIFFLTIFILILSFDKLLYANDDIKDIIHNMEANVIFLRHTLAPGIGDPNNFKLNDCSTQRNLNEKGRNQAILIGKKIIANNIKFNEILSSEWCRCIETIQNMNIGIWKNFSGLNSFYQGYYKKENVINSLRKKLNDISKDELVLMVTHQVVIEEITGIITDSGGMVLYNSHFKKSNEIKFK